MGGGGGSKAFLNNVKKTALFSRDGFPKSKSAEFRLPQGKTLLVLLSLQDTRELGREKEWNGFKRKRAVLETSSEKLDSVH